MKNKRLLTSTLATICALVVATSGTFTWNSFDQVVTNKTIGYVRNPGVRLHIDAYFEDMNVYVENFMDVNKGEPIYARVRMSEYMEIGEGSGEKDPTLRNPEIEVQGQLGADINDITTWDIVYMNTNGSLSGIDKIREYLQIGTGGQGVYMPTFNKNKDSHLGDTNGTLEGPDGVLMQLNDAYDDFVRYTIDGPEGFGYVTDIAQYDADEDDIDEENPMITSADSPVDDADIYEVEETHYAKETLTASLMSMKDWMRLPSDQRVGPYWVYDVDGWAYWAQPLMPNTATGLLLDRIIPVNDVNDDWYYIINAHGEFTTANDWGNEEENTGFYQSGITQDALSLLNSISR